MAAHQGVGGLLLRKALARRCLSGRGGFRPGGDWTHLEIELSHVWCVDPQKVEVVAAVEAQGAALGEHEGVAVAYAVHPQAPELRGHTSGAQGGHVLVILGWKGA